MHAVLTNFRPHEFWVGSNSPTPALAALMEYAKQEGIAVRRLGAGDEIAYGGISIRVLAPVKDHERRRPNDDCLALKLTFGRNSVLMEGDAEGATERDIVQEEPAAQLLKVGHHGSATSTSRELLAAVHPQAGVVSVGRGNSYGHPRYQVLQRLQEAGVAVYRTDMNGQVTFYMDGESINVDLH